MHAKLVINRGKDLAPPIDVGVGLTVDVVLGEGDCTLHTTAIIDTGSNVGLSISTNMLMTVAPDIADEPAERKHLRLPTGQTVRARSLKLPIRIGAQRVVTEAIVVPELGKNCLIGLPLLDQVKDNPAIREVLSKVAGLGEGTGLTLYFNTRLTPFDRFLVDGVIFGVLGKETDCRVAEYQERGETAIIRLEAESREDLEAVAEALHRRVWGQQEKTADGERRALIHQLDSVIQTEKLASAYSALIDRLHKMELWLSDKDIPEYLEDTVKAHRRKKDQATVTPAEVKAAKTTLKLVKKWVLGEAGELVEDGVKGMLPGEEEGEE